jgi:hypothetical protein
MDKQNTSKEAPVNLKEQNAVHTFRVTIRDREHFYKLVNWLNQNVGKGEDKWTMEGRVLKTLKSGKTVNPKIYIFRPDFDVSSSLYLSLL